MPIQNLRREVFRRPTERVGLVVRLHVELAQAKVAERDVPGEIQQDVLGFEIPSSRQKRRHDEEGEENTPIDHIELV